MELTLATIARWTGGEILQGHPELKFNHYNFDSRNTIPGELFFALKAERDGHDFILDACHRGAAGAVVSRQVSGFPSPFALLLVPDTLRALQEIGRQVLRSTQARVVGITGSVGKTTTKELVTAMLSSRYRVIKSEKNFNNDIGLPLTLLRMTPYDEIAVLEMAMRGPGEIKRLTEIAPPEVAVLTGIHPVHLEFFPSIKEIARAKKEILEGTNPEGTVVLNGDDPLVMQIAAEWKGRRLLFGFSSCCEVRALSLSRIGYGGFLVDVRVAQDKIQIPFPFLYEGQIYNLLAACSVAHLFSIPLEEMARQAASMLPLPGRAQVVDLKENIHLIDDTYNSNPRALEEALRSLASLPARRRVAVLGDMLELGPEAQRFHQEAGKNVFKYGWDILVTVGPLALEIARGAREAGLPSEAIHSFADSMVAGEPVASLITPGDLILIKGSRGVRMERIVEYLKKMRGGG